MKIRLGSVAAGILAALAISANTCQNGKIISQSSSESYWTFHVLV